MRGAAGDSAARHRRRRHSTPQMARERANGRRAGKGGPGGEPCSGGRLERRRGMSSTGPSSEGARRFEGPAASQAQSAAREDGLDSDQGRPNCRRRVQAGAHRLARRRCRQPRTHGGSGWKRRPATTGAQVVRLDRVGVAARGSGAAGVEGRVVDGGKPDKGRSKESTWARVSTTPAEAATTVLSGRWSSAVPRGRTAWRNGHTSVLNALVTPSTLAPATGPKWEEDPTGRRTAKGPCR